MEENLIKALSSLTGIRESKLRKLNEDILYEIIDKPHIVEPTKNQLEKLNLLNELIINFGITKEFKNRKQIDFSNSDDAGKYFKHLIGNKKDKEVFLMAMLDKNNNLIKIKKISEGTINSAAIYPRDIIKEVLSTKCKSVIFCHNHPSGVANPSPEDISLTKDFVNILEPLKVNLKDHIIVGDDIFSFLEKNILDHDVKKQSKVAEKDINDYISNSYYKNHLSEYLNSLSELTGIKKEKLYTYIEYRKDEYNNKLPDNALEILENPSYISSKLGLSSSERNHLNNLNRLFNSFKSYVKKNVISVSEPKHIFGYARSYLYEKELDSNNLYMMLFNNKNKPIGFEKLSYYNGDNLIFHPKDILQKPINYEAHSISIIMTSKKTDKNYTNRNINDLISICKNAVNILLPVKIKLIDSLYINEGDFISLKEEGLLPYTGFGQPEYKKTKVFDYSMEEDIIVDNQLYDEFEDEDEWEFEL